MICNMDSIGKYMLEIILHQQRTPQLLKQKKLMQTQEDHSNPIPTLNVDSLKVDLVVIQNTCFEKEDSNSKTAPSKSVKERSLNSETKNVHAIKYKMSKAKERCMAYFRTLISHLPTLFQYTESRFQTLQYNTYSNNTLGYVKKSVAERTRHQRQYERRVNKRQMQTQESKIDTGKALDANLVDTESIRTDSTVQDDNNRSGNDTDADDCRYQTHLYDRIRANGLYGTIVCWM
ncbi:hypothetical protein Tco_1216404 [Tanacetum coccineum]